LSAAGFVVWFSCAPADEATVPNDGVGGDAFEASQDGWFDAQASGFVGVDEVGAELCLDPFCGVELVEDPGVGDAAEHPLGDCLGCRLSHGG